MQNILKSRDAVSLYMLLVLGVWTPSAVAIRVVTYTLELLRWWWDLEPAVTVLCCRFPGRGALTVTTDSVRPP